MVLLWTIGEKTTTLSWLTLNRRHLIRTNGCSLSDEFDGKSTHKPIPPSATPTSGDGSSGSGVIAASETTNPSR